MNNLIVVPPPPILMPPHIIVYRTQTEAYMDESGQMAYFVCYGFVAVCLAVALIAGINWIKGKR